MIDISNLTSAILDLIVSVLVIVVIPSIKRWLSAKMNKNAYDLTFAIVETLVNAAEQLFEKEETNAKKQYVIEKLAESGIALTDNIDAMIEAAVHKVKVAVKE